jgi:pantoate--beta-alanine ligase
MRERDGVALSSRNSYLTPEQRKSATVLHRALMRIQAMADKGERSTAALLSAGRAIVAEEPGARLDYLEAVDQNTLEPLPDISKGALVAIAAWVGNTRLIDNVVLFGPGQARGPITDFR